MPSIETLVVAIIVIFAAAFVLLRVVKTFRGGRPACCTGGDEKTGKALGFGASSCDTTSCASCPMYSSTFKALNDGGSSRPTENL